MIFIEALSLAVLALFAFSFVISSVWEKEKRAAPIGGVAFPISLGGEIGLFALRAVGFSQSTLGFLLLLVGLVIPVAALLLSIRTGRNPRALQGTAALFASFSIPGHLGSPHIVQPEAQPYFHEEKISLSPEEATSRVKGFARHLGADLVGIAEINPLWVYSRRGEIFWDNWDDWGSEIERNLVHG